jgi:hypothetical protein
MADNTSNLRYRFVTSECPICGEPCNGSAYIFTKENGTVRKGVVCMSGEEPDGWTRQEKLTKDGLSTGWFNYYFTNATGEEQFEKAIYESGNAVSAGSSKQVSGKGFISTDDEVSLDDRNDWATWAQDQEIKIQKRYPSLGYKDLENRGLSQEAIERYDFVEFNTTGGILDVPPFIQRFTKRIFGRYAIKNLLHGIKQNGSPSAGYYIPIYNYCGEVTGYQLRYHKWKIQEYQRENPRYKGKYVWAKGNDGNTPYSSKIQGELPLQTLKAVNPNEQQRQTLLLTEGVLKPLIMFENLGRKYSVMGSAGGLFATSRHQFVASLLAYKLEYGITHVCWCADPGSFRKRENGRYVSTNVISAIKGTKALVESCGLKFKLLNWEQWYEKNPDLDPDVVDPQVIIDQLPDVDSPKPFDVAFNNFASRVALHNRLKVDYVTHPNAVDTVKVADARDVLSLYENAVFKNKRVIINGLSLGAGKTFTLGEYEIPDVFNKLWYFSQSPREPATAAIERDFYPLIGRHGGLIPKPGILTPLGEQVYKLPPEGYTGDDKTEGNCARYDDHKVAVNNGIAGVTICRSCPFFISCKEGTHEHYDYLYQRITSDIAQKIRANVLAVVPEQIEDTDVVVFDEPIACAPPYVDFALNTSQARAYVKHMNSKLPDDKKVALKTNEDCVYLTKGELLDIEVLAVAEAIDDEIREEKGRNPSNRDRKYPRALNAKCEEFFTHLLNPDVKFSPTTSGISAVVPNLHVREIVKNAGQVIFLDATCEPEMLAAQYGLNLDDILYITNDDLATNSVEVEVLQTNHMNARRQKIHQKKAIMHEVRNKLTQQYKEGIGFIAHSEFADNGEIILFSNSRGSNLYQYMEAICIFGLPQPNLGVIEAQYKLLPKDYRKAFSFNDYYNYMKHSELKQAIGRIRGYQRQGEHLKVYIVANAQLSKLEEEGYRVKYRIAAFEGIPAASTRQTNALQDIWRAAIECVEAEMDITPQMVADQVGKARQTITQVLRNAGTTFNKLRAMLLDDVQRTPDNGYVTLPWEVVQAVKEAIPDISQEDNADYRTLLNDVSHTDIMDCFVMLSRNKGKWPKYLKGFQVRTLLIALAYKLRYFLIIGNGCDSQLAWDVANLVLQKSIDM